MTKHFHIVLWMPIIFSVLFFSFWIVMFANSYTEMEEYLLNTQANYAADSAMEEMLDYSATDTDYANGDFLIIEPDVALDDFCFCLANDFEMDATEQNKKYIQNKYIRTMIVTAYDGIYAYWLQKDASSNWSLARTPKIPYFYTDVDTGIQYALTLNADKGYQDFFEGGTYKMARYNDYINKPTEDRQNSAIDLQIEEVMNWCLAQSYGLGKTDVDVEIPVVKISYRTGAKAMDTPTVIALVEGRTIAFDTTPIAECMGGASVEHAEHCVGYTYNGEVVAGAPLYGKFYSTEFWWADHPEPWRGSDPEYFDDKFKAAKAGYADLSYLE